MSNETPAGAASHGLRPVAKAMIVVALVAAIGTALYLKEGSQPAEAGLTANAEPAQTAPAEAAPAIAPVTALPRLVNMGAKKCIPCKMMAPILEQLKKDFDGRLAVEFIDVWENPGAGEQYGINVIPTQIFYDASGKEQYRHEGFLSREDILAKWKELGADLSDSASNAPAFSRMEPAQPDTRPAESVCYMCDGDVDPKTRVVLGTDKGDVYLCSPIASSSPTPAWSRRRGWVSARR